MQLKISAHTRQVKHEIRRSRESTIRRVSNEKMSVHCFVQYSDTNVWDSSCDKTKEILIQLYEYRRKYWILKNKVQVLSKTVLLQDNELYTEKTYESEWTSYPMAPVLTDT